MAGRVVIAEDDAALAYSLGHVLEKAGYDVAIYTNSTEAWDALKVMVRPGLLIADLVFPTDQPNGLALAAHANRYHRQLPVIFMTGYRDVAQRVGHHAEIPLLGKPIDETALMQSVRQLAPL